MIKIEKVDIVGWEPTIRGMRNPHNSWNNSDSFATHIENPETLQKATFEHFVGDRDQALMSKLANGGPVHAKYRRMIVVYLDITAPLYWWKEFDTYKVGTVANSCSTMHKIQAKKFELDDFSCEHLGTDALILLEEIVENLNIHREAFNDYESKVDWWHMIQLLPSSYNQKRTVMLNYEVLVGIYKWRKNHKLDEWKDFCKWIETLPYSFLITGEGVD